MIEVKQSDMNAMRARVCRAFFWQFVQSFWSEVPGAGKMIPNWHMEYLCQELQTIAERVFRGEKKEYDLVINISPGTSKSTICSILYPAWIWARMPSARIISASHTDMLVLDLAVKARCVIESEKYQATFPGIELRGDQDTKGYYANTQGGDRLSCTVGGKSPMGFHAHFLITDDPLDPKKALSALELKNASDFMTNVLPSRKVNKEVSVSVLIMQRLHEIDPTGITLSNAKKEGAGEVNHICLPASLPQDEHGDYLPGNTNPPELAERYVDGLMDVQRLSRRVLNDYRIIMGPYGYSGQFDQNPIPLGGGMFQRQYFNQRVKAAPYTAKRILYVDRACLVAGTMVETLWGSIPIESVESSDFVLTRDGYRKVKWAGPTKEVNEIVSVLFSNGSVISGTADHRIWTENRGWIELASLDSSDYNLCIPNSQEGTQWCFSDPQIQSKSSLTASHIHEERESDISLLADGINDSRNTKPTHYIERSGDSIMGTSPLAMMSTTRMGISTTTRLKIFKPFREQSIIASMIHSGNSTEPNDPESIIENCLRKYGQMLPIENTSVCFVRRNFNPEESMSHQSIAASNAGIDIETVARKSDVLFASRSFMVGRDREHVLRNALLRIGKEHARAVGKNTKCSQENRNSALDPASLKSNGGIIVYDIQVEGKHEFFANGVLVHNSTAGGGCNTAMVLMAKDVEGNYYIEHVVKGQWEPHERNQRTRAEALRCRHRYGPKNEPKIHVEREGGSSGRDAWRGVAKALEGFSVWEDTVTGSKQARAEPWSAACAANIVYIVEDGTWDIEAFIQEHCSFPLGQFVDQVDAASGGFNLLTGPAKQKMQMQIRSINGKSKNAHIRLVVASKEALANSIIEQPAVLISIADPAPVGDSDIPMHGINKLLDSLKLQFMDASPEEHQQTWDDVIAAYDKPVAELLMQPEQAKKIWAAVMKKRASPLEVLVIQDDGDKRAVSVALALAEVLRIPKATIYLADDPEAIAEKREVNRHVFDTVKSGRGLVVT